MRRLFFDMDGTLAKFTKVTDIRELYEEGKFFTQLPEENLVLALRELLKSNTDNIYILSAYLEDSLYALSEKNAWLDKYIPEIPLSHRIFIPCGIDKREALKGEITKDDFLLDDYTVNLNSWDLSGTGIKFLNGINHTKGTWKGMMISHELGKDELVKILSDVLAA